MKIRVLAVALILAGNARGGVDVRALRAAASSRTTTGHPRHGYLDAPDLGAIVALPSADDPGARGLPKAGPHFVAAKGSLAELAALAAGHPTWRVSWSPPLRELVDKAAAWSRVPEFRSDTGLTGKGAVVGIVDAGIDVRHPDLRNPDGTTRIAWLIDFSRKPTGNHAEENICTCGELACPTAANGNPNPGFPCAIFSASEIDALIASGAGSIPSDPEGHGTHVASLAAGNGGPEGKYVGMAPEASLIIAVAANSSGVIDSAVIPLATSIVFQLAEEMGRTAGLDRVPAVVNLSLGSDFGNHDGGSDIELALADLVGTDHPGRVVVAAAGNSAAEHVVKSAYPNPLGIHTEVNVPERSSLRVPIVTTLDPTRVKALSGQIFVWISFRPGDDVAVGVDQNDGAILDPVAPGQNRGFQNQSKDLSIDVVNGGLEKAMFAPRDANAAVVVIDGTWPPSETFAIRLEGRGTASLWVETGGGLGDQGAVFPAATKEQTISIPASSPSVIAVGATLNRTEWTDRTGHTVTVPVFGSVENPEPDSVAYFSSAGPTSDRRMKPEIVAPGAFVVGAMSGQADPLKNDQSAFTDTTSCASDDPACAVVDDDHGVLVGTSMASPIAAGAVALLLAEDPSRTQEDVTTLLQAGARFPRGLVRLDAQLGAGALDLEGVRDVEAAIRAPVSREPVRERSWVSIGESYAHPDPGFRVPGILELRDADGRVADAFGPNDLVLEVDRGTAVSGLVRMAPGFYRFAVAASSGTGGDTLHVAVVYRDAVLLEKDIPIAVDVNVAREGFSARGGCTVSASRRTSAPVAAALALIVSLGRRRTNGARKVRNPDRTGKSARGRPG